jgi:hypothetical protein
MKRDRIPVVVFTFALIVLSGLSSVRGEIGNKPSTTAKTGEVDFPISCSAPARPGSLDLALVLV